jgi:hypothetical protein
METEAPKMYATSTTGGDNDDSDSDDSLDVSVESINEACVLTKSLSTESSQLAQDTKSLVERLTQLTEKAKVMAEESELLASEFAAIHKDFSLISKRKKMAAQKLIIVKDELDFNPDNLVKHMNASELDKLINDCTDQISTDVKLETPEVKIKQIRVRTLVGKEVIIDFEPMMVEDLIKIVIDKLELNKSISDCRLIIKGNSYMAADQIRINEELLSQIELIRPTDLPLIHIISN